MAPRPDISVVIPTYRRPCELRDTLTSVLRQPAATIEVIVVDDCEAGSARDVAAEFPTEIVTYLRNPHPSRGRPAAVRNLGLSHCTGELIHFLDDDDIVPDGYYAAVLEVFRTAPDTQVVFGRIRPFGENADAVRREATYFQGAARRALRCRRFGGRWGFAAAMLFRPTLLVCGAAILRRSCLPTLKGFDTRLPLMEDVDFYARAIRLYGARFLDRLALHYRIGPSLMHQPTGQQATIDECYRRIHDAYRRRHGWSEYVLLKLFALAIRV